MTGSDPDIVIDYYSDVLCVWAWIAQPRLEELHKQWQDKVVVQHHYVDIFGDCYRKIPAAWGEQDGFEKFGDHVLQSATPFEQAEVNPEIWRSTRPRSSAQAHVLLRAASLVHGDETAAQLALRIRSAFFRDARDIGNMQELMQIAAQCGADEQALHASLNDGSAIAAYSTDLRRATELGVRGSPTWILNAGRQVLYGNVGYRILSANIEELLRHPQDEASWC